MTHHPPFLLTYRRLHSPKLLSSASPAWMPSAQVQSPWPAGSSTQAPCTHWWPPRTRVPTTLPSTALRVSPRPWASSWHRRGTSPVTPSAQGGCQPAAPGHAAAASLGCRVPAVGLLICWAAQVGLLGSRGRHTLQLSACIKPPAVHAPEQAICALCRYVLTDLIKNQLEDTAKARGIPKVSFGLCSPERASRQGTGQVLHQTSGLWPCTALHLVAESFALCIAACASW